MTVNFLSFCTHIQKEDSRLYEALKRINGNLQELADKMSQVQERVLVAALTNITADFPPALESFIVVFLRHDATGDVRAITWSVDFKFATTAIDETTPNNTNVFTFHGKDDGGTTRWFCVGEPIIGAL